MDRGLETPESPERDAAGDSQNTPAVDLEAGTDVAEQVEAAATPEEPAVAESDTAAGGGDASVEPPADTEAVVAAAAAEAPASDSREQVAEEPEDAVDASAAVVDAVVEPVVDPVAEPIAVADPVAESMAVAAAVAEPIAVAAPVDVAEGQEAAAVTERMAVAEAVPARGARRKRVLTGNVVSDKSDQTIVVAISRRKQHRLYRKYITLTKKVMAHDPDNQCRVGDLVRVVESRPLSKEKRWRLIEIVKRAG